MAQHERLTDEVLQLQNRMQQGKLMQDALLRLLQEWLLTHIEQSDKSRGLGSGRSERSQPVSARGVRAM